MLNFKNVGEKFENLFFKNQIYCTKFSRYFVFDTLQTVQRFC